MGALAVGLAGLATARGQWGAVAFLLFIAAGFGWVSWLTWRAGRTDRELGRRAIRTALPRVRRAAALLTTTKQ